MTQSKFDLQNLPDLKIRVANAAESERAQRAFFALGYRWYSEDHSDPIGICPANIEVMTADGDGDINIYYEKEHLHFEAILATAVTLPELEALAAENQKNERDDKLFDMAFNETTPIGKNTSIAMDAQIQDEWQTNVKESTIFTYHKEGILKALTFSEAQKQGDKLISEGWAHTATLHAGQFIQHLFNDCGGDEIVEEIYMLDGTKKTK
jgi:hypothetical protein